MRIQAFSSAPGVEGPSEPWVVVEAAAVVIGVAGVVVPASCRHTFPEVIIVPSSFDHGCLPEFPLLHQHPPPL